jgi:hypothetical protein
MRRIEAGLVATVESPPRGSRQVNDLGLATRVPAERAAPLRKFLSLSTAQTPAAHGADE